MNHPFVFVKDFQYVGHTAFGVWDDEKRLYQFGDGDFYTQSEVAEMSDKIEWLSWPQIENRLRAEGSK